MQKHLTYLTFLIALALPLSETWAQCTPDSTIDGLYAPDEQTGLPEGDVTVMYEAVITLNVPEDTTYQTFTAEVDNLELLEITGLPPGFSYECFPASCIFPGGEYGCIRIFGITDDNAHAKTWDIEANFDFNLKTPPIQLPYTIEGYAIILDSVAVGISEIDPSKYRFNVEPNPLTERSVLQYELPKNGRFSLDVYSLLGNNVSSVQNVGKQGMNEFQLGDFSKDPGVYFISLKQGNYTRSMRFIVR